jgi:hypothetical protein
MKIFFSSSLKFVPISVSEGYFSLSERGLKAGKILLPLRTSGVLSGVLSEAKVCETTPTCDRDFLSTEFCREVTGVFKGEVSIEARDEDAGIRSEAGLETNKERLSGEDAGSGDISGDVMDVSLGNGGDGGAVVTWLNSPGLSEPSVSWKRKSVTGL